MGSNYYLNNVNSIIGENARYARQFLANQASANQSQSSSSQSQSSTTQSSDPSATQNSMMSMLNPMLMLMLFQMLSQMMPNLLNNGQSAGNPLMPPLPYGLPVQKNAAPPTQNPAYQFINNQLTGAGTSQPQSQTTSGVDFTDNESIKDRITAILSTCTDPSISYMASMIDTMDPSSPDFMQSKLRADALLQSEGRDTGEFDMLAQAATINPVIASLNVVAANTPNPDLAARINALTQMRTDLANQWAAQYGDGGVTDDSQVSNGADASDLTSSVKTALQQGQFTETQLGQSLKYMLANSSDNVASPAASLLSDLMESGDLNVAPFLSNDYLNQLSPDRQDALLGAVESSGLRMANGKPNSRFIGFMIDQMGRSDNPTTKQFLQQFLQDFYDFYGTGDNASTPVGDTLANILDLTGTQADQNGQLVFS